jgi:MoxR-like ATPase
MELKDVSRGGEVATLMERILYEVKKIIVGQDHFLERVLVAILAQGHLLVEGVPGLAKTLTVKTLARTVRGSIFSMGPSQWRAGGIRALARRSGWVAEVRG